MRNSTCPAATRSHLGMRTRTGGAGPAGVGTSLTPVQSAFGRDGVTSGRGVASGRGVSPAIVDGGVPTGLALTPRLCSDVVAVASLGGPALRQGCRRGCARWQDEPHLVPSFGCLPDRHALDVSAKDVERAFGAGAGVITVVGERRAVEHEEAPPPVAAAAALPQPATHALGRRTAQMRRLHS
eukprot:4941460-Prymnesium_polylepis.1